MRRRRALFGSARVVNARATSTSVLGYGLECEAELKMLRVMHREAVRAHAVELSPTYLGAHSVPKGSTASAATSDIVERQLPALVRARDAGQLRCENIDAFVEKGVFEPADAQRLLAAGAALGLRVNFHGDELSLQRRCAARRARARAAERLRAAGSSPRR